MKKSYLFKNIGRISIAMGLFATISLSSCLKDTSPGTINFGTSPAVVGFQYYGFSATPLATKVHGTASDTTDVEITLSVASITLGTPVSVTVAPDLTDATAYAASQNAATAGSANVVPLADYSLANNGAITIPAGHQTVQLKVSIKGNLLDFTSQPIIALKITGANGATVATNLNVAILAVTLQSIYEGRYTATGGWVDNDIAADTDDGVYPEACELVTQSAFSVYFYGLGFGEGAEQVINGGAGAYGSWDYVFNFDPAGTDKIISVTNYYGQASGPHARSGVIDPTGINAGSGTPGTVGYKIQVKFFMYQGDIGINRLSYNMTYTYTGPI